MCIAGDVSQQIGSMMSFADVFLTVWRKIDQLPTRRPGTQLDIRHCVSVCSASVAIRISAETPERQTGANSAVFGVALPEEQIVQSHESSPSAGCDIAAQSRRPRDLETVAVGRVISFRDCIRPQPQPGSGASNGFSRALKSLTKEFNRLDKESRPTPAAQEGGA